MDKIHRNGVAPFRFLTPFPHHPPQRLRNSACQTGYSEPEVRIQSFFHQIDLHVLRHTRRPISSTSLGGWIGKAKSSRSLLPFPCILPTQSGRDSIKVNETVPLFIYKRIEGDSPRKATCLFYGAFLVSLSKSSAEWNMWKARLSFFRLDLS